MLAKGSSEGKTQSIPERKATLFDLGSSTDYKHVWEFQKALVEKRRVSEMCDSLILNEHDHVLTIGRNGHDENLLEEGLPLHHIERGGDITYHGPGQLVAYPIIYLPDYSLGIKQYVQLLEQVIVSSLEEYGIKSEGRLGEETGVWTESGRKIASIGVAVSHWVTYHGFALNVSTDLTYFEKIRPCGFDCAVMTSVEREIGKTPSMNKVKGSVLKSFSEKFGLNFQEPSEKEF